ncbi:N-acetylmuramoyl-L-alanine amidase [Actinomadura craniellae]|uniref:N-acetylmuramoyl-L-alanine amidase n=1 Tax=Actinomadura craniellae TaxID=2231787 RepID=A0A365H6T3_9ACTN|nr:peptidoglycan recognition family protein [Actinomadura craniellae]RAY14749.1 N-acetylmuramoyl-L-alanine amidase [Actinomadura craniellae]
MITDRGSGLTRRALLGGTLGAGLSTAVLPGPRARAASRPLAWPRVHARYEWRATGPRARPQVLDECPDRIVVHHTATANSEDYSVEHAYALSRSIQRFHMRKQGWDDIGEHLTISRGGYVMEGRQRSLAAILTRRHVVGAHTRSHNHHTVGIETEGTYMRAAVPDPLWSSLVVTCAWLCTVYGLDPERAIAGHRDFNATNCPGDVLYDLLPELRRAVAARMPVPPLEPYPPIEAPEPDLPEEPDPEE